MSSASTFLSRRSAWALGLGVAAVFARALGCDFFGIDDRLFVLDNPGVNAGISAQGIVWAFTNPMQGNWTPLAWLSHMLDMSLFGPWAPGHHATSVALHVANALLLFRLLDRMTGRPGRSALAAALFALHPMRAESVVWVAERRDVLSGLFALLSLNAYAHFAVTQRRASHAASLLWFAMGLASKASLVSLPCLLLLLDLWPLRRVRLAASHRDDAPTLSRLLVEKLPFFALTALASAATILAQADAGAVVPLHALSLGARFENAAVSSAHYVLTSVWPVRLSVMVMHPSLFGGPGHSTTAVLGALGLLAGVSLFVWLHRRRGYPVVGWLWFLGTLVPMLGFVQAGLQALAYRYTYLPHIGLFILASWTFGDLAERLVALRPALRRAAAAAGLALAATAGAATFVEIGYWRTTVSVFEHGVEASGGAWNHFFYLGSAYLEQGEPGKAVSYLEEARKRLPRRGGSELAQATANLNLKLGMALEGAGQASAAAKAYHRSLAAHPLAEARAGIERLEPSGEANSEAARD